MAPLRAQRSGIKPGTAQPTQRIRHSRLEEACATRTADWRGSYRRGSGRFGGARQWPAGWRLGLSTSAACRPARAAWCDDYTRQPAAVESLPRIISPTARQLPCTGDGDQDVREIEASLQPFGEFLLKAQLVTEHSAPYFVRWVRRFLTRSASDEPLADQVRRFCEELEHGATYQDWQIHQAEQALPIY